MRLKAKTNDTLPVSKTSPSHNLKQYPILIYGRERVGKTTLCAEFDEPLFLFFEPGGKSLSLYAKTIKNWNAFLQTIEALETSDQFKTVVIDTVDKAHDMVTKYVCKKEGIQHPSDLKWGRAWSEMEEAFEDAMFRILRTGRGLILTSHSEEKDIVDATGDVRNMTAPTASKQVIRFVRRYVDLILYYYYGKNGSRWIRIQGNSDVVAGSRIDGHFKGVIKFNAGSSAKEAYTNLIAAFENKLGETTNGERKQGSREGVSKILSFKRS